MANSFSVKEYVQIRSVRKPGQTSQGRQKLGITVTLGKERTNDTEQLNQKKSWDAS